MSKEKLKQFIKELNHLENKHGIFISAQYEELPYDTIEPFLGFIDKDGNHLELDGLTFEDTTDKGKYETVLAQFNKKELTFSEYVEQIKSIIK